MSNSRILLAVLLGIASLLGIGLILLEQPSLVGRFGRARWWLVITLGMSTAAILGSVIAVANPVVASQAVAPNATSTHRASIATVLHLVAASDKIRTVPFNVVPSVAEAVTEPSFNFGGPPGKCQPSLSESTVPSCVFGDRGGTHTMVLYGDSHAAMWFKAIDDIAIRARWRLVVISKGACPAALLPTSLPNTLGEWKACDIWHRFAIRRIRKVDPDLLIVTQNSAPTPSGSAYNATQWQYGLEELFERTKSLGMAELVLGNIPSTKGPDCLAEHSSDVQACSSPPLALKFVNNAERRAAAAENARYINITPWFCARSCNAIIGTFDVYFDTGHIALGYSHFLEGVLAQKLDLPHLGR